jgi:hypothetical protein
MKTCIVHGQPNEYYRRSDNTAICHECLKEIQKKAGNDDINNRNRQNNSYGIQANNSMLMKNTAMDKEKILPIAEYAETFFGTVKQKYEDLIAFYEQEQETIQRKQNYFRIES